MAEDVPKKPRNARYVQEFTKHEPHPDCPDTLSCLPDTDGRPQHTLPVILRCAILGSPRRRLTIREIYAAMEDKYEYYKTAGPTWKVTQFLSIILYSKSDYILIAIGQTSSLLESSLRTPGQACHRSWVRLILDRQPRSPTRHQKAT